MGDLTTVQILPATGSDYLVRIRRACTPRDCTAYHEARFDLYHGSAAACAAATDKHDGYVGAQRVSLCTVAIPNLCRAANCPRRAILMCEVAFCEGGGCANTPFHAACIEKIKPWWMDVRKGGLVASGIGEVRIERDLCEVCWRALGDEGAYEVVAPLECWDREGMPVCETVMDVRLPKKAREEVRREWEEWEELEMLEVRTLPLEGGREADPV